MWKWFVLCVLVLLWGDVSGDIQAQMTDVIRRCCNDGSVFARSHTSMDCSSSQPVPSDVPSSFGPLCIMAKAQCCTEYFQKKEECDAGIKEEHGTSECTSTKQPAKACCTECARGASIGRARGSEACIGRARADTAEELLSDDAYVDCCLKAAKQGRPSVGHPIAAAKKKREGTKASLCEDFAPTELCAHHCIPVPGSFRCECNSGFMLMADGKNCKEVVKNRCKHHNPCQHKCNDNGLEVMCSCRRGYQLMPDRKSCQDIDECQLDSSVCLPETQCQNTQGSYRCLQPKNRKTSGRGHCPPGFAKNIKNKACDDINECKLPKPPCSAYLCENTVGGYKCGGISGDPVNLNSTPRPAADEQCPSGFVMGSRGECEDIDECAMSKDDCNPLSQYCINTHSSFYCQDKVSKQCRPGFKIDTRTGKCEDINECAEEPNDLCRPDQICVNQLGQYDCKLKVDKTKSKNHQCPEGMRINPDTQQCDDIDECVDGTHLCDQHQTCLNTNGSFECHCKLGYELDRITGACVDLNECATGQHTCISGSQRCDNTVGSYLCIRITSCGTGYILQHATGNCEDVDECALGIHNCARAGPEFQCLNILGSFRCVKKRQSTTTAAPEYEYVYYDDDEEEINETSSETKPATGPTPVVIPFHEPSSSTSTTTSPPIVKPISEDNSVIAAAERGDNRPEPPRPVTESTPPAKPEEPMYKPEEPGYKLEEPKYKPEKPRYEPEEPSSKPEEPSYKPEERQLQPQSGPQEKPTETPATQNRANTESEITYSEPKPEIVYKERSEPPQRKDTPESTYYETRNEPEPPISNEITPENTERPRETTEAEHKIILQTQPSIVRLDPRATYSPYRPTAKPTPTPQREVIVKVEDSAVWEDENIVTPTPCPPGFENEYGGCFDIDECATNQHTCSGLTESCRNTMGAFVCDCAPGFRRDQITGACDVYSFVSPTTPLPPIYQPDLIPSIRSRVPTQPPWVLTEPPPVPTQPPRIPTQPPWVPSKPPQVPTEPPQIPTELPQVPTEPPQVPTEPPQIPTEPPHVPTEPPQIPTEPPQVPTEPPQIPTEPPRVPTTTATPPPTTVSSTTAKPTTPRSRSFMGYKDDRFASTRPFYQTFYCDAGYHVNPRTGRCEDVNECLNGLSNCASVEVCLNTQGGYRCECQPNWLLDEERHRCVPVSNRGFPAGYGNVPVSTPRPPVDQFPREDPPPEITQVENRGSVLQCPKGYRLGGDNNCVDVDECVTGEANCGPDQFCTNLPGGYTCSCRSGFRLSGDHQCEDVDECQEAGSQSICSHNADCVNTIGSYQCQCHDGFRSAPVNDKVCVDVDECSEARTGSLCQHRCSNVWGSYRCFCHRGYRLKADNRTCADVNECVQFKSKIPCVGTCLNEPGSYRCTCPPGYRLSEDKRSCIDIDECETGEASCETGMHGGTSHVCFNTRGSYRCQRISCPPGYQLESKHRCTKTQRVCGPGDWECAHQPTTISYNFITFVSNLYVPDSNVKLFTMRGPTWPFAKMRFELRLVNANAPPSVKNKADINAFLLIQTDNEAVMSLVRPLEGPQSIELELSMELYSREQFGGIAVAKLFIYVSEYEF